MSLIGMRCSDTSPTQIRTEDKRCTCDGFHETFPCRLVDTQEISGDVSTIMINAIIYYN
jgi:hypothetical protein